MFGLAAGAHCNYYFLQMVAMVGRGYSEIAYSPDKIVSQITQLLTMANVPVLTDVSLDIDGVEECELYPFPVPDLFLGAPIIISGKYQGDFFPNQVRPLTLESWRTAAIPMENPYCSCKQ